MDVISGCGGLLSSLDRFGEYFYTTQVLTKDCTINASFRKVVVSSRVESGGSLRFSTPMIDDNGYAQFEVIPEDGFVLKKVSGCGSFLLEDDLYSTEILYRDCALNVTFKSLDPLYADQWHLKNTGQAGNDNKPGKVGEDINVKPVWQDCQGNSCRGEGVRIVVVDDSLL